MSTVISQPAPLAYSHRDPLPGLSQMLGQGAITAIVFYYVALLYQMLSEPNGYDLFLTVFMPVIFGYAAIFGAVLAFVSWVVMQCAGRRLSWWMRITTASLFILFVYRVLNLSLTWDDGSRYAQFGKFALLFVVTVGSVTGSQLSPGRVLIRGLRPLSHQSWFATSVGFVFRTLTLFGWMEAVFEIAYLLSRAGGPRDLSREFVITFLILTYFSINSCFAFFGNDHWLLSMLAVLVNGALVFVVVRYWHDLVYASYFIIAYLSLWFTFLLTHLPNGNRVFASLKDELRYYYLVD